MGRREEAELDLARAIINALPEIRRLFVELRREGAIFEGRIETARETVRLLEKAVGALMVKAKAYAETA